MTFPVMAVLKPIAQKWIAAAALSPAPPQKATKHAQNATATFAMI